MSICDKNLTCMVQDITVYTNEIKFLIGQLVIRWLDIEVIVLLRAFLNREISSAMCWYGTTKLEQDL